MRASGGQPKRKAAHINNLWLSHKRTADTWNFAVLSTSVNHISFDGCTRFHFCGYVCSCSGALYVDGGERLSVIETVIVLTATSNEAKFHAIEMRIVPSKEKTNRKRSAANKGIMDLLKNASTNRHRIIKKPQRIKPRYGIYDSSAWARVKRHPVPPPIVDIAQPPAAVKPLKERVKARHDGNLDFLLENQSEKNSKLFRPVESYINLAFNKRNDESQYLSQHTEMRYAPPGDESNPKQSDATNGIMDLLENGRKNRHRSIKKQPRIKPRYGIFGSSAWARVKRDPIPPPIVKIAQSQAIATPLNDRVKSGIDDDLDFLLESLNEPNSKQKDESKYLLQQTEYNEAETKENVVVGGQAYDSQYSIFGGNQFENTPSVIDVTTPLAKDVPVLTPFSEFSGTINSMDFRVANPFYKEPMAYFETPTPGEANTFEKPFNDIDSTVKFAAAFDVNRDYFSGQTFDAFNYNGIGFDELNRTAHISNAHKTELTGDPGSGWGPYQLGFDDFASGSGKSMDTPSSRYEELSCAWTPGVVNYNTVPRHQPLSEQLSDRIRSKISENMLEVIRKMKNCHFPAVCDDSFDLPCVEYGSEWRSYDGQTIGENRPMISYQTTEASATAYSENGASATTLQKTFNNAFFRNNNVTIMQTCTATRIIRSAVANSFSREFGFYEFDDDNFQF